MVDDKQRWDNYRKANDRFPEVRRAELDFMFDTVSPALGKRILECGTGNGYLTIPLAQAVGNGIIVTYDPVQRNLDSVIERGKGLPIDPKLQTLDYKFEESDESFDKVCSIATFHHYDDRSKNSGVSGRLQALKEFRRLLQPNGTLIIADVAHGTKPQEYFDAIDNPLHCAPYGHPHDFMDEDIARDLCARAGLKVESYRVEDTPWRFDSEDQAKDFLHAIHNAHCTPEESLEMAKRHLPYNSSHEGVSIGWQLFYMIAKK